MATPLDPEDDVSSLLKLSPDTVGLQLMALREANLREPSEARGSKDPGGKGQSCK